MLEEKLKTIIDEFYELKKEITSGDISIRKNYVLFKKFMLMLKLFEIYSDRYVDKLNQIAKHNNKKTYFLGVTFLIFFLLNPLTIFFFIYGVKKIIDQNKELKSSYQFLKHESEIIDNVGEIVYGKLLNGFANITDEENLMIEAEAHNVEAKPVLTSEIYNLLQTEFGVNAEVIGDVENQVIYIERVRKLQEKTNH